jgi:uncharacterized protein YbjT (DUF2867 family)
VIKFLIDEEVIVFAADLNPEIVKIRFGDDVQFRKLDFYDVSTFESCLEGIDRVFLMRPPQIGKVKKYIFPFINLMKKKGIKHVVTLSIADAMPFVPHYKIEKYLEKSKITYTHLRAGYFMQNLSTTHKEVIKKERDIFVPAGDGKISFTDVRDIAEVAATILKKGTQKNRKLHITGDAAYNFYEVAEKMSSITKQSIKYSNPSGKEFKKKMLSYNFDKGMVRVMGFIYSAVKKHKSDRIYPDFKKLLKKDPISLDQYLEDYAENWIL